MAKDSILVGSFDEAGDAAYRVYASTRELLFAGCGLAVSILIPVSYTHLDVYKRQPMTRSCSSRIWARFTA